ncbi:MAG: hypothetical protein EZS28_022212 [Streblomastix strix]|uniref:Uncharacterized protein n=1 Tax=Streblomastix strix TaxID=222440 RepID=A0A5J4VI66_9EUKA|nr:MAG: hypothetical protein EZS28_022212 [Streblomastix strix]
MHIFHQNIHFTAPPPAEQTGFEGDFDLIPLFSSGDRGLTIPVVAARSASSMSDWDVDGVVFFVDTETEIFDIFVLGYEEDEDEEECNDESLYYLGDRSYVVITGYVLYVCVCGLIEDYDPVPVDALGVFDYYYYDEDDVNTFGVTYVFGVVEVKEDYDDEDEEDPCLLGLGVIEDVDEDDFISGYLERDVYYYQ